MQFINDYFDKLNQEVNKLNKEEVKKVVDVLYEAWKNDRQVFILGNGGSASTASHFACDLGKGTLSRVYDLKMKRFRVISLTDNVAIMTAFANDLSYDDIFSQQLHNLVRHGDIVIAITGSGNSKNVIKAIDLANKAGAVTIAFLGFEGGKVKEMADHVVHVKCDNYGIIEDIHLSLNHVITSYLKEKINS